MKPVLIQTIIKNRRKQVLTSDPVGQKIEKTADQIVSFVLVALFVIVVGSIAITA